MLGNAPRFLTYQVGHTFLHRLDPRTKLLGTGVIVADALMANLPWGMAAAFLFGGLIGLLSAELLPALFRLIRPLFLFLILFSVLVIVTTPGHAIAHIWIVVPTTDGVVLAIRLGLQVLLIAYTTSLLTLTTPPLAVADALQWTFGFLEKVRVPVRDIIAMIAIGLTFVPLLLGEAQRVFAAQRARGANLSLSTMDEESMGALLIPLLLANLRRGEELAESMESRLYGTGPRTSLHEYHFGSVDGLVAAVLVAASGVIGFLSFGPVG
jgi:energy-coupling factor transport system permease protein